MDDLISRQAAIREYQEVCNGIKCGECPFLIKVNTEKGSHLITDCKLEAFLHNLPSAVRHGRWIIEPPNIYDLEYGTRAYEPVYRCSCCGRVTESYLRLDEPIMPEDADFQMFCGWCGAKMDEENRE